MMADMETVKEIFKINELHQFQKDVLSELLRNRDVFLSVKTGGGKSLCYEAFQPLWEREYGSRCCVLVVTPLISIMKEQTEYLNNIELSATYIGKTPDENEDILQGTYKFLFASPESLLSVTKWRDMLTSPNYIRLLVVDEAHTVLNWGESDGILEPFRIWYGRLGEIRSLLECPLMLITATANKAARTEMKRRFCMTDCYEVIQNPDRDNIKLFLHKFKSTVALEDVFFFLLHALQTQKEKCDRYVIFCTSIKACSDVYSMFRMELGQYVKHIEMYHSQTPENIKEKIKSDLKDSKGLVRVLVATSAAGMGVNFSEVKNVINFGPPKDMDTFLQQIGRAGRSGGFSSSLLLYNGKQCKNIDSDVRAYLANTSCRRENLLSAYNSQPKVDRLRHLCCDVCAQKCPCEQEDCDDYHHPFFLMDVPENSSNSESNE